ncbi:MAG: L-lactate dehydrogenase [Oscillatoriales cyanobacterium RM2_1_1]|nr:L-lactate dehydrogenase [Oscillatoriales cyanobacterium SM2_3_0]NJO44533.1 L-lactate dehydrogenase [Oscillatoriales cyanobacterium RM2_1_1]
MFEQIFNACSDGSQQISTMDLRKGVIIGAGQVGMACAYSMLIQDCFDELILQDIALEKVEGEVMDLMHGIPFISPTKIAAGTVADAGEDTDIVIITAGANQKDGETRLDLVQRNVKIFRGLVEEIAKHCPNAILLIVSNPVDIMTYVSLKISGFPSSRVLGSGTVLDTARFRSLLSAKLNIDSRSVHANIIGEHGDSEVPVWSKVNVAGMRICDGDWPGSPSCDSSELSEIFAGVKNAAYEIIKRKGYTSYAVGLAVTDIVKAILNNQNRVLTVSSLVKDLYDLPEVCLSFPTIVNRQGISKQINLSLNETEKNLFQKSAQTLHEVIAQLDL